MRDDQRAIVRRQPVEIAVGDRDHVRARQPLAFRNHALRRRMRGQVIRIVERGVGLRAGRHADARIALARDVPLGLADFAVLHFQSHRHDVGAALFFERSKIARLPALGIEIPALHFAQLFRALPQSRRPAAGPSRSRSRDSPPKVAQPPDCAAPRHSDIDRAWPSDMRGRSPRHRRFRARKLRRGQNVFDQTVHGGIVSPVLPRLPCYDALRAADRSKLAAPGFRVRLGLSGVTPGNREGLRFRRVSYTALHAEPLTQGQTGWSFRRPSLYAHAIARAPH